MCTVYFIFYIFIEPLHQSLKPQEFNINLGELAELKWYFKKFHIERLKRIWCSEVFSWLCSVTYCKTAPTQSPALYPLSLVKNRQKASRLRESILVKTYMCFLFGFGLLAVFQMNCKTTECTDFCINIIIVEHVITLLFFNKMSGQTESDTFFIISNYKL